MNTGTPVLRTPTTPYGALIGTRLRIVTWNLWWRLGDWQARAEAIAQTLERLQPDLVCLQEVWQQGSDNQAAVLGRRLGMQDAFAVDQRQGDLDRGVALLSRWPLADIAHRSLPAPEGVDEPTVALRAVVEGPRGPILVLTTHLLPFPPRSAQREQQVRALVSFIAEKDRQPPLIVLGGDFNAAPDSDEIRLLTGRRPPAAHGWIFLDAWETAGDGSPGYTMAQANPNAAPLLLPNLRWDYIFVNWPSLAGGGGHPVHAELAGVEAVNGVVPSDHYAVVADLRY